VWDALTGRELGRLEGHQGAVWSAAWSPDGSLIATAGGDGDVRIWDAVESIQLSLIHAHEDAVRSVAWDRDGARIITGSSDHTARIWPVGIAGLLELADSLIRRNPPDFTTNERCAYLHDCGG
jgi:WD40 repeat protein